MSEFNHPDFENIAKGIIRNVKITARVEGENFFRQSFGRQGWLDQSLDPWDKRKYDDSGRAILVKSGKLQRSIKGKINGMSLSFGPDGNVPYARLHNEGGVITVTIKMKKYFWAQYIRVTGGVKTNMPLSDRATFFKAMALKKVGTQIKIPKRQFIGESRYLLRHLDKCFNDIINNQFNKI